MKFRLSIDCNNAAFEGENHHEEIADILIDAAKSVRQGACKLGEQIILYDTNGNRVGTARLGRR